MSLFDTCREYYNIIKSFILTVLVINRLQVDTMYEVIRQLNLQDIVVDNEYAELYVDNSIDDNYYYTLLYFISTGELLIHIDKYGNISVDIENPITNEYFFKEYTSNDFKQYVPEIIETDINLKTGLFN